MENAEIRKIMEHQFNQSLHYMGVRLVTPAIARELGMAVDTPTLVPYTRVGAEGYRVIPIPVRTGDSIEAGEIEFGAGKDYSFSPYHSGFVAMVEPSGLLDLNVHRGGGRFGYQYFSARAERLVVKRIEVFCTDTDPKVHREDNEALFLDEGYLVIGRDRVTRFGTEGLIVPVCGGDIHPRLPIEIFGTFRRDESGEVKLDLLGQT